jgi:serine protease AprX
MGLPLRFFLRIRWAMLPAALAIFVLPAPATAQRTSSNQSGKRVEVIVQLRSGAHPDQPRTFIRRAGGRVTRELHLINGLAANLDRRAVRKLARRPWVRAVSVNSAISSSAVDTSKLATAYDRSIPATDVWNAVVPGTGSVGAGTTVAVIDSGIQSDLPDFRVSRTDPRSRVIASAVVNPDATTAADEYGHGTHVAGIIAGNGTARSTSDPLYGKYIGVAPATRLVSIKVSDDEGDASTLDVISGLQFAVDRKDDYGIQVVNLSLTEDKPSSYRSNPLDAAVEQAWNAGLVVIAASGNRGRIEHAVDYAPGNDPFVITVGAADDHGTRQPRDDTIASWSSVGTTEDGFAKPDFLAPGAHITSTLSPGSSITSLCPSCVVDGDYFRMGGTSMATAVTSGAVALLLARHPGWTPNEVKSAIASNVREAGDVDSELDALPAYWATKAELRIANDFEPNGYIDPDSGEINYERSSWSRSSWSRSSWSRSSWSASFSK